MNFLTGMYNCKFDDKGRLTLPARLRNLFSAEQVKVLPGFDGNYLTIMSDEKFEEVILGPIYSTPQAMFDKTKRELARRLIAPAISVSIDASGRINIPLSMREEFDLLNKGDALLVGTGFTLELWNPDEYKKAMEEADNKSTSELAQELFNEA